MRRGIITVALFIGIGGLTACLEPPEPAVVGESTLPHITTDVDVLAFGEVLAGEFVERSLAVTSEGGEGGATLFVEQVFVQGSDSFSVDTTDMLRELPPDTATSLRVR